MKASTIFNGLVALFMALFVGTAVSLTMSVNPLWIASGLVVLFIAQVAGFYCLNGRLPKGLLMMALVAYDPCTIAAGSFTPAGDCIDQGSGIFGMYLVKKGFDLSTIVDQTTLTAAKTALDMVAIKDIEAFWPSASQQTIPGIAGRMERHGRFEYEMPFKHEGVDANLKFWNTINQNKNYGIVFVTEEYKAFAPLDRQLEPVLCAIQAVPASDQEFGKTRYFQGTVKWKHKDLVQYLDLFTPAMMKADFQP